VQTPHAELSWREKESAKKKGEKERKRTRDARCLV
jgi:hypothetical protein